ncbi:hypothetical protein [Roseitranquillus sediminis]|uniref:hypothetical protein n=1 Tax=Roseitranquillus sediminis TaxID=2809051 RepID=UPI001D0CB307|nr:hypothetical protein [Roseitranquillus sediminis]MBM9593282.1 hypothetical protein [Roseitranquillus sediminis]
MTFASAVGAIAAFIGGLLIYSWQKRLDRQTEMLRERREAYNAYVSAAETMGAHTIDSEGDTDNQKVAEYRAALARLQILATDAVLSAAIAHKDALNNLQSCLSEEGHQVNLGSAFVTELKAFEILLTEMRKDNLKPFRLPANVTRYWGRNLI